MNLPRIMIAFPDQRLARIDLQLGHEMWGRGLGTRAIKLLTEHAFDRGDDLVFAVDISDFNSRSRRAFLRCGFVPWRRVPSPPGAKAKFVYDLVCRPSLFRGTVATVEHPGEDHIRAGEVSYGATVVVYRRAPEVEVLVLHRSAGGAAFEGDWAWTPPAGTRFPAEPIDHCAARELHEKLGLDLQPQPVEKANEAGWAIYVLEVRPDAAIELDDEHDRYEWLRPDQAAERCSPRIVGDSIAVALLGID